MIYLVQLTKDSRRNGGCATFTEHLWKALNATGYAASVFRVGMTSRTESKDRQWANDCPYRNYDYFDFVQMVGKNPGPVVITVVDKGEQVADDMLARLDPWFVFHDFRSNKNMTTNLNGRKVVQIREANLPLVQGSVFIPHPYKRFFQDWVTWQGCRSWEREFFCVSHTRIDFDKRTHLLLEANKQIPTKQQIQIFGRENRLYSKFKLQEVDPTWQMGVREFGRGWGAAQQVAARGVVNIDMTLIRGDGGGSQYSTLEAMDAGCLPLLAKDWGNVPFKAYHTEANGTAIADALAKLTMLPAEVRQLVVESNWEYLHRVHNHENVGRMWLELFRSKGEL